MSQLAADRAVAQVRGVCPIVATPFTTDGELDVDGFVAVVRHLLMSGVSAVMFPGYASEYHKLRDEEARLLIAILLNEIGSALAVISINKELTSAAVEEAGWAVDQGARLLSIQPPSTSAGASETDVVHHIDSVLRHVAPTPVMIQHAGPLNGMRLEPATLLGLADKHANLRLLKVEAQPPGRFIHELAEARPPIPALVGYAGLNLPDAVDRGAIGVQPGSAFVEIYVEMWARFDQGARPEAHAIYRRLLPYVVYWMQNLELSIAAHKTILARRGLINSTYCRDPSWLLDARELMQIDEFFQEFSDILQ